MDFNKKIPKIEQIIGYVFKDKSLLMQAFTRSSFCNEKNLGGRNNYKSNEVLEFFGDSILSAAIVSIFLEKKTERYEHGIMSELREGDFSNLRSKLSDKRNLAKSTAALGIEKFLILGEGDEKMGIASEPSVMEDLFESVIGAVYIDCSMNMKTVINVVSRMLDTSVYFDSSAAPIQSFKNALQEFCADKIRRLPAPIYKTLGETGPDHRKEYERGCYVGDRLVAVGKGKNQKLADTAAAEKALEILKSEEKQLPEHDSSAPTRLRALAISKKAASPEWRDLGETEASTENAKEFSIECRAMGITAKGIGASKQEARARAAEAILNELSPKKAVAQKKNSTPKEKKKKAAEIQTDTKAQITKKAVEMQTDTKVQVTKKTAKSTAKKVSPTPKKKPHWHAKRS